MPLALSAIMTLISTSIGMNHEREENWKDCTLGGQTQAQFHHIPHWMLQGDVELRHLYQFPRCESQLWGDADKATSQDPVG